MGEWGYKTLHICQGTQRPSGWWREGHDVAWKGIR